MVEGTALAMEIAKDTKGLPLLKTTGNIFAGFSLLFTGYQLFDGQYSGRPGEAVADVMMSLAAFVPGWGCGASGVYFVVIKPIIKSGE